MENFRLQTNQAEREQLEPRLGSLVNELSLSFKLV